jgi:hypothetical protein
MEAKEGCEDGATCWTSSIREADEAISPAGESVQLDSVPFKADLASDIILARGIATRCSAAAVLECVGANCALPQNDHQENDPR